MPELTFDNGWFDFLLPVAGQSSRVVQASIVTNDKKVEDYWGVLEFGSKSGQRPWPNARKKTRRGADGRIYSSQAVNGFVRPNADIIWKLLSDEYDRSAAQGRMPTQMELIAIVNRATEATADLLRKIVPVDSGKFKSSIAVEKAT